jgi:hypothetical protein
MDLPRFRGANASGLARAVVNESGRLIDLEIDPELLRRPAALVAEAVLSAVLSAQDQAGQREDSRDQVPAIDIERVQADFEEANREAERRLAEFAALVQDLSRGLDNRR